MITCVNRCLQMKDGWEKFTCSSAKKYCPAGTAVPTPAGKSWKPKYLATPSHPPSPICTCSHACTCARTCMHTGSRTAAKTQTVIMRTWRAARGYVANASTEQQEQQLACQQHLQCAPAPAFVAQHTPANKRVVALVAHTPRHVCTNVYTGSSECSCSRGPSGGSNYSSSWGASGGDDCGGGIALR